VPELPEIEALAHHLRENAVYRPVARVDVAGMSVLKTAAPPVSELVGRVVTGAARYGKFLAVEFADRPDQPLHLITHLSRAGWMRWHEQASAAPPKPGRGPLALRVHLDAVGGPGFDLTEAGTQKRLSVYLVAGPKEVPGIARLGPDALALSRDELAELLAGRTERIKTLIVDQSTIAGIGNAYSDEILHTARLSPYAVAGRLNTENPLLPKRIVAEADIFYLELSLSLFPRQYPGEMCLVELLTKPGNLDLIGLRKKNLKHGDAASRSDQRGRSHLAGDRF